MCGLRGGLHHGEAFERGLDAANVLAFELAGGKVLPEAVGDVLVVVRERLDEARGVACLETVVALLVCNLHVAGAVAQTHVSPQVAGLERLGFQLEPFGAAFAAVHADAQPVAVAERGLAEPDLRTHVVRVLHEGAHVVHNLREESKGGLVGDDMFGALPGQEVNHVVQVAAEIKRNFRDYSILETPGLRLGWLVMGPEAHEAFLRHLDLHLLDLAEPAVGDELLEFAHHRVAGVVVCGAEESFGVGNGLCDGFAFRDTRGKRFFANHGEPGVQRVDDDILVQVGRREHYHCVEFAFFGLQQVAVAAVGAVGGDAPGAGGLGVRFGVGAECARYELEMAVHLACRLVDFSDGRVDAAPDKRNLVRFLFHHLEYRIFSISGDKNATKKIVLSWNNGLF